MNTNLKNIAIVIWRIVGVITIFNALSVIVVQVTAIDSTFGQIMDDESLYTGEVVLSLLIWPTLSIVFGLIAIIKSKFLAELLIRGIADSSN